MSRVKRETSAPPTAEKAVWKLKLYVANETPRCLVAFANLKRICEQHLTGRYHIEVIDLIESPELSRDHRVLAIPTVVRTFPGPELRMIGDLSNTERVLASLGLPGPAAVEC